MAVAAVPLVSGSTVSMPVRRTGVRTALARMETGNLSDVKGVGSGVLECRIHVGPGYRVYFGRDGDTLIVLLGGWTKASQQRDIEQARELWQEYKRRK